MESKCVANNGEHSTQKEKVTELGLVVRVVDGRLYYEIKYKKVGENHYRIGYSSYSFENVLHWKDECFEVVANPRTNGDRIRNMTDEELADFLSSVKYDGIYYREEQRYPMQSVVWKEWLQSESEVNDGK